MRPEEPGDSRLRLRQLRDADEKRYGSGDAVRCG